MIYRIHLKRYPLFYVYMYISFFIFILFNIKSINKKEEEYAIFIIFTLSTARLERFF